MCLKWTACTTHKLCNDGTFFWNVKLVKAASEVKQCTSFPDTALWFDEKNTNFTFWTLTSNQCIALCHIVLQDPGSKTWQEWWICSRWRHCQPPKALLASVLTDEGRGADARNNQTALRAGKINTEGNCILPEQMIKKLKHLMIKCYVQMAFISDFSRKKNDG